MLTFLANDSLAGDALADLERDPMADHARQHARHRVDLTAERWIRVKVHLRSLIVLFQRLLVRYHEHFPLLSG